MLATVTSCVGVYVPPHDGGEHKILKGELLPPMCSPPDMGGALHFGGELKGEHFFLRIRSAPPQTGGEHKGEHFGKLGAAGENFRVLASDVDKKYVNFIKLRQIIVKLAPQAKFLGIGSKFLKITSAPPPQTGGGSTGGSKILKIQVLPPKLDLPPPKINLGKFGVLPPNWGGAQGGAFSMSGGSRGERSPPSPWSST